MATKVHTTLFPVSGSVGSVIPEFLFLFNAEHPDVVSIFPNKGRKLHTTRSWNFVGLERDGVIPSASLWKKSRFGEDTIIGNLDTGELRIFIFPVC